MHAAACADLSQHCGRSPRRLRTARPHGATAQVGRSTTKAVSCAQQAPCGVSERRGTHPASARLQTKSQRHSIQLQGSLRVSELPRFWRSVSPKATTQDLTRIWGVIRGESKMKEATPDHTPYLNKRWGLLMMMMIKGGRKGKRRQCTPCTCAPVISSD